MAEFDYQPGRCTRPYRVVVVRKNSSKTRGDRVLFDDLRELFAIATRTDLTVAEVVYCANRVFILILAMVIRRARTITMRLIRWQPSRDKVFSAWRTIERPGYG